MRAISTRNLDAELHLTRHSLGARGLGPVRCPKCRKPLNIHQPEHDYPDDLLGSCPSCGRWSYVSLGAAENQVVVVDLPIAELVREALAPRKRRVKGRSA